MPPSPPDTARRQQPYGPLLPGAGEVMRRFRLDPERQALVRACYLDEDLLAAGRRLYASEEFQAVLDVAARCGVGPPGTVLDLGGGCGVATLAWAQAGFHVHLLEPDPDPIVGLGALRPHLGSLPTVSVHDGMGEALPFADATFHIVYVRQVLHHVTDLDSVCREVRRVLKPVGVLLATREHVISRPEDLPEFLAGHPVHQLAGGEHAYPVGDYAGAMRRAGFAVDVVGPWESPINHYPVSTAEVGRMARERLGRWVGDGLAARLLRVPALDRGVRRWMSRRDHTPGRMVSFVARPQRG